MKFIKTLKNIKAFAEKRLIKNKIQSCRVILTY